MKKLWRKLFGIEFETVGYEEFHWETDVFMMKYAQDIGLELEPRRSAYWEFLWDGRKIFYVYRGGRYSGRKQTKAQAAAHAYELSKKYNEVLK